MILQFLIFGAVGICMEVLWTGLGSLKNKDYRLTSSTSIWMFFIYGSAAFLGPVVDRISFLPFFARGMIYMVLIFAAEYAAGYSMKKLDACPWDYGGAKYSVQGIIRLDYAPVWFAVGMIFEYVHNLI